MVDANLKITIDTTAAEAGAKRAARSINDIQDAASKLTKNVNFAIDPSRAESGAKKATDSLRKVSAEAAKLSDKSVSLDVNVNEDAVRNFTNILDQLSRQARDADISVGFDTSGMDEETAELVRKIKAEIDANLARGIPVETSLQILTEAAQAEIDRAIAEAEAKVIDIPVDVDGAAAEQKITRLRDEFGRFIKQAEADSINIPVEADTQAFEDSMGKLRDARGRFLPRGGVKVKVDADVSGVVSGAGEAADALRGIGRGAEAAAKGADKARDSLSAIEAAAKKASDAADNMGDAFRRATQEMEAMEIIAEALLAISTSMITAITAFEDYTDAVTAATGSMEAGAAAMQMIESFSTDNAVAIEDVTNAFVALRTNGLEASRDALTAYGNVAAGVNLTMEELAEAVGEAAAGNFSKLNETQIKAEESGKKVIFTYMGVKTEVENTSQAIAAFIRNMGNTNFAGMMEENAEGVTGAFSRMQNAWHELSRDIAEGGLESGLINFQNSMTDAAEAADNLGRILGGWLGDQATLLGKDIEGIVDQLNDLVDALDWVADKIEGMPSVSSMLGVGSGGIMDSDFMKRAFPVLYAEGSTPTAPEQGPPTAGVSGRVSGRDEDQPRKPPRTARPTKSPEEREAERRKKAFDNMLVNYSDEADALAYQNAQYGKTEQQLDMLTAQYELWNAAREAGLGKDAATQESIRMISEGYAEAKQQARDLAEAEEEKNAAIQRSDEIWRSTLSPLEDYQIKLAELQDLHQQWIDTNGEVGISQSTLTAATKQLKDEINSTSYQAPIDQVKAYYDEVEKLLDLQRLFEETNGELGLSPEQAGDALGALAESMNSEGAAVFDETRTAAERYAIEIAKLNDLHQLYIQTNGALGISQDTFNRALEMSAKRAAESGNSLQRLAAQYGDVGKQLEGVAMGAALNLEDSLVDIATGAKSAKEAFADFARSTAEMLMRTAIQMAIIRPLLMGMGGMFAGGGVMTSAGPMSLPTYAKGGVMTQFGDLPLKTYATGGVANSPQMAIFGEGRMPEAYVPLPDGRRIPVKMEGGAGGQGGGGGMSVVNNINVNMPQGGKQEDGDRFGQAIARQVEDAMNANLMKQQRPGGLLDPYGYGT